VKNITHPIHPWMGMMFFYLKFMEDSEKCKSLVIIYFIMYLNKKTKKHFKELNTGVIKKKHRCIF